MFDVRLVKSRHVQRKRSCPLYLSLLKIISGRSDDAVRTELAL
jgi:hypothetical protein